MFSDPILIRYLRRIEGSYTFLFNTERSELIFSHCSVPKRIIPGDRPQKKLFEASHHTTFISEATHSGKSSLRVFRG